MIDYETLDKVLRLVSLHGDNLRLTYNQAEIFAAQTSEVRRYWKSTVVLPGGTPKSTAPVWVIEDHLTETILRKEDANRSYQMCFAPKKQFLMAVKFAYAFESERLRSQGA